MRYERSEVFFSGLVSFCGWWWEEVRGESTACVGTVSLCDMTHEYTTEWPCLWRARGTTPYKESLSLLLDLRFQRVPVRCCLWHPRARDARAGRVESACTSRPDAMLRGSLLRLASSPRGGGLRALCSSSRPSATDLLSATRPGQSVVWIAPCARTFKAEAAASKGSTFVFRDEVDPDYFSAPDALERATTVVVSAQSVTKDFMQAWRASLPDDEKLTLVRRGTSLGSIDVNAAKKLGIRVANTPGVNSPHVAKFVVDTLGLSIVDALDVALARAVVIGSGSVGQSVIALLNQVGITPTVVNRSPESPKLEDALKGATHVAVCAATSGRQPERLSTGIGKLNGRPFLCDV